jgi:membrane-bound lytic murein transglycosylase D
MGKASQWLWVLALVLAVSAPSGCGTLSHREKEQGDGYGQKPLDLGRDEDPDSRRQWELKRSQLVIHDHPAIAQWVERFTRDADRREDFRVYLKRAVRYVLPMQEVFSNRGLPGELAYLPLVESGFSCTACSRSDAVGMWQFIDSTGRNYGLRQTFWIDERRSHEKSTLAAAEYLSVLYDMFHDWPLALAAYNCGENGLRRTLRATGLHSYWQLLDTQHLHTETKNYVPKFLAAVKILRTPERYGFRFDPRDYQPWYETVEVPGGMDLFVLEKLIGVPETTLSRYNPELHRSVTPPHRSQHLMRVPIGEAQNVKAELKRLDPDRTLGFRDYTVCRGDTLYSIAKRHGCSVHMLARINNLEPDAPLTRGRHIFIPRRGMAEFAELRQKQRMVKTLYASSSSLSKRARRSVTADQQAKRETCYPVRQGDTLWSIAQRFRVPVEKLRVCNELSPGQPISPGDLICICVD